MAYKRAPTGGPRPRCASVPPRASGKTGRGLSSYHRALTLHRGRVTLLSELFRRSASGGWDFRVTISPLTAGILGDCEQRAFILRHMVG